MSFTEFLITFREIFCFLPFSPIEYVAGDYLRFPVPKLTDEKTVAVTYQTEADICTVEPFLDGTLYIGYKKPDNYARQAKIRVYKDNEITPIVDIERAFGTAYEYEKFECQYGHTYTIKCYGSQTSASGSPTFFVGGNIGLKDKAIFMLKDIG